MKRFLILTSMYTGHGHKSASDALAERLESFEDIEVKAIDGFSLMNPLEQYMAEYTYGPITRMPGKAWEWNYVAGKKYRKPVIKIVASMIREKLLALLEEYRPDAIISVHPVFTGTIVDVLERENLKIPFFAHEVDLVDISDYWFDSRFDLILAPSRESYECTVAHGVPKEKVVQVGFPVRRRFIETRPIPHEGKVITVMSGAEGSGMLKSVTHTLLLHTNAKINVVCGRNKKLRKRLRRAFQRKFGERLNIMGFVSEIENVMAGSDLLVLRASPNSVMEAVAMRIPVVMFGRLAGQELHNPQMLEAHGLAKYCDDLQALPACLNELLSDESPRAGIMREAQRAYAPEDEAARTAKLILNWLDGHHAAG